MKARHPHGAGPGQLAALLCVACGLCLQLSSAAAQPSPRSYEQTVEVIDSTPVPGAGQTREHIAANVQRATALELERSRDTNLGSFLARRMGSVHVNDVQNNPFQPDVNYRGFTASPLLGNAQGLSVYLDGVRLNQPFGDVVSWDLIPRTALSGITLMPGSNPLFGLNTLGGALSVQTKDGRKNPGTSMQLLAGSNGRKSLEFEAGDSTATGLHGYVTGNRYRDNGWRVASHSNVAQLFGKLGYSANGTDVSASLALADNLLVGNGLQELRLLAAQRNSVYSLPDENRNRALLFNLGGSQQLGGGMGLSGVAYFRKITTATFNGDVNDLALDQSVYQASATELDALAAAGYSGVPASGSTAANTPFPKWRCIANALLNDEPAEKCNAVINTTRTLQSNYGAAGQFSWNSVFAGRSNLFIAGAAIDASRVRFAQGSELGYLNADRSVTGVGAFGDGGVSGGVLDGAPYDTRVQLQSRSQTWSAFATDTLVLAGNTALTLSGRYNRTAVDNVDAINPGGGPGSLQSQHRFARLNPGLGLTHAPNTHFTSYVGWNQGSRAPSAIELGCADPDNPCRLPNALAGDPPLKQVVAQTLEAGVHGKWGESADGEIALRWNVGLFRTDNRDDLLFVADNTAGFGYFKNFGRTRRQGLEAGFSWRGGALGASANYTWLDATYRSAERTNGGSNSSNDTATLDGLPGVDGSIHIQRGDRLPLQPRHLFKVSGDLQINPDWLLGADLQAVASSLARGNENGQHQPDGVYYLGPGRSAGFTVLNLSAEFKPSAGWKFFAQINNALNRRFSTAAQLGAVAFDAQGRFVARPFAPNTSGDHPLQHSTFFAPGAPRAVQLGVKISLGD